MKFFSFSLIFSFLKEIYLNFHFIFVLELINFLIIILCKLNVAILFTLEVLIKSMDASKLRVASFFHLLTKQIFFIRSQESYCLKFFLIGVLFKVVLLFLLLFLLFLELNYCKKR